MRPWVKVTLAVAALMAAAFVALAGTGAYLVLRHMEKRPSGEPERVQLSPEARGALTSFDCEPRGKIDIKGLGPLETWFLLRRDAVAQTHAMPESGIAPHVSELR